VFAGYLDRAVHFMELPGDIPNRQVNARNLEAKFPCYLLFSKIFVYSILRLHYIGSLSVSCIFTLSNEELYILHGSLELAFIMVA
jgi:hypothetical protein